MHRLDNGYEVVGLPVIIRDHEVLSLMDGDNKINSIRNLRNRFQFLGLREAQDVVEDYMQRFPGEIKRGDVVHPIDGSYMPEAFYNMLWKRIAGEGFHPVRVQIVHGDMLGVIPLSLENRRTGQIDHVQIRERGLAGIGVGFPDLEKGRGGGILSAYPGRGTTIGITKAGFWIPTRCVRR